MIFVKLLLFLAGAALAVLGVRILFLRRYSLIFGYEAKYAQGKRDESYARTVGKRLILGGAGCCALSILCLMFGRWFTWASLIVGLGGTLVLLAENEISTSRRLGSKGKYIDRR